MKTYIYDTCILGSFMDVCYQTDSTCRKYEIKPLPVCNDDMIKLSIVN